MICLLFIIICFFIIINIILDYQSLIMQLQSQLRDLMDGICPYWIYYHELCQIEVHFFRVDLYLRGWSSWRKDDTLFLWNWEYNHWFLLSIEVFYSKVWLFCFDFISGFHKVILTIFPPRTSSPVWNRDNTVLNSFLKKLEILSASPFEKI
jgi:hypothetical protein